MPRTFADSLQPLESHPWAIWRSRTIGQPSQQQCEFPMVQHIRLGLCQGQLRALSAPLAVLLAQECMHTRSGQSSGPVAWTCGVGGQPRAAWNLGLRPRRGPEGTLAAASRQPGREKSVGQGCTPSPEHPVNRALNTQIPSWRGRSRCRRSRCRRGHASLGPTGKKALEF